MFVTIDLAKPDDNLNEMVSPPKCFAIRLKIKQASRLTKLLKQHVLLSFFIFHLDNALNSESLSSAID